MLKHLPIFIFVALLAAGCAEPADTAQKQPNQPATSDNSAPGSQSPEKPVVAEVPATLKHAAYEYYGLGNSEPVNLEIRASGQVHAGSNSFKLVSQTDGRAEYQTVRTGALEQQLGNDTVIVTPAGVQISSTTKGKLEGDHLVPADLRPGASWKVDVKITQTDGNVIEEHTTWKAVRVEPVTTKAGKFEALLTTATGTFVANGESRPLEGRTWFVKGRGLVKSELKVGKEAATLVIEAT